MRSRSTMLAVAFGLVAVFLFSAGLARGQSKFPNVDTAKDRQDAVWGTRTNEGQPYFGTDENENEVWGYRAPEPEKPVDWYDKVVITVNPEVDWPGKGQTASTTQSSTTSTGGGETNATTTTTTTVTPNQ